MAGGQRDGERTGNTEHVADAAVFAEGSQCGVAAVVRSPYVLLPGFVHDSDRVRVGQVLDHGVTHDAHRLVFIPHCVVEQPLHLVRGAIPGPFSQ